LVAKSAMTTFGSNAEKFPIMSVDDGRRRHVGLDRADVAMDRSTVSRLQGGMKSGDGARSALIVACIAVLGCKPSPSRSTEAPVVVSTRVKVAEAEGVEAGPAVSSAPEGSCDSRVAELGRWAQALVAEGEYDSDPLRKPAWAKADLSPSWLPAGVRLDVDAATMWMGEPIPRDAAQAGAAIRAKLAQVRSLRKSLGLTERFTPLAYVEASTPWSRVVDVSRILVAAGESEVAFVLEARPGQAVPPPDSELGARLRKFMLGETDAVQASESPEIARCAPAVALSKAVASEPHSSRSKIEKLATGLPKSIRECGCDVDVSGVKARLWAMMNRYQGRPVAAIALAFASKKGELLVQDGASSWQSVVEAVIAASKEGRPVTLAVR
jgi:hypothetical protein